MFTSTQKREIRARTHDSLKFKANGLLVVRRAYNALKGHGFTADSYARHVASVVQAVLPSYIVLWAVDHWASPPAPAYLEVILAPRCTWAPTKGRGHTWAMTRIEDAR